MIVLAGWGALLMGFAALQLAFGPHVIEIALLGGAGLACLVVGLLGWRGRLTGPQPGERRRVAVRSMATVLAALGVALMAFGAEAGPWLVMIGAGATAIGLGGVAREWRAERRS
ncbi:hypothetical protein [Capillimicrobium parvum]|uniref:Uncharacterized protein n=1 Tax=Capillimicrobium parvum TaxID=2884022 RepID=A0A9E7C376_9ACTN|nr:hypothetical protein [Capillimicrobium parvum]UGS38367.1 hypothetical protein DSM104329_04791 [Capillimicrobium parvum]